jgi:hypothetical protein
MRLLTVCLACTVLATAVTPSLAGSHKHHSAAKAAQAQHLKRLAVKEKKAWREHLAKLRSLPHAERVAEKRHERKWQRVHNAKVEEMSAETKKAHRHSLREAKLARRHHGKALVAATPRPSKRKSNAQVRHLAALVAANQAQVVLAQTRHSVHARKLAALAEAHRAEAARHQSIASAHQTARVAANRAQINKRQALRALHQANLQAAYHAHEANAQAAHNARLVAARAHWIALHGDSSGGQSIRFWQTAAAGVPVKVISVDLNDTNVKVSAVMARHGNGTAEPFRQMIDRANPNVAVTGTFFSLGDLQPVGDIVIDGSLVHFGGMGTALCITPANHAEMVTCQWGRHHDWSPYDFVVACGPRLLQHGSIVLDPHSERFGDKHMLAPNSRIAVGITRGNTLFFVMTHQPIYLGRLARVMRSLGAAEAMNLDAGTSTGFYYNGATLAKPGRKLTNMIVVYGRRDRYERALDQLVPAAYHRTATRYRRQLSQVTPTRPLSRTAALVRP